jgi:hypothetical protein
VIVALAWLSIAVAAVIIELVVRRSDRFASLGDLGRRIGSQRLGRLALVACWAFVGWHVFARYTVPPL